MYLSEALKHFKNKASLARALGISKQAVSRWPEDSPIPEVQQMKLKYEILPKKQKETESQKGAA